MLREERLKREKAMSVWSTVPLIPSAFSPAFSSCSLTTSFMCCHWGSPSPISWTLTSPLGLLPVLYLVILILTWSSAAWSGLTRQKRDKHHSWPHSRSPGPQDGGATSLSQNPSLSNIICGLPQFSAPFSDFVGCASEESPLNYYLQNHFMVPVILHKCVSRRGLKDNASWDTYWWNMGMAVVERAWAATLAGYLAVLDPGCGCSCAKCWPFDFL